MKHILLLLTFFAICSLQAQETKWQGPSIDFKNGKLKISENQRFIVFEDGTPFFYLGDTAWELFHRVSKADTEIYLENPNTSERDEKICPTWLLILEPQLGAWKEMEGAECVALYNRTKSKAE